GFAVEVLEPTVPPVIAVDRLEEAVLVTPKEISAPSESQDEGADNWAAAFFSKRYDDAVKFLDAELIVAKTGEYRILNRSVVGYVRFEQDTALGIKYFEELVREHPNQDEPYQWYGRSYYWRDLHDKAIEVPSLSAAAGGQPNFARRRPMYSPRHGISSMT